jgi:hypothetical protein
MTHPWQSETTSQNKELIINLHRRIFTGGTMLKGRSKLSKTISLQDYVQLIQTFHSSYMSEYAQLNGHFDFSRTPLAPPGTRVIAHEKPDQ